jgi:hypothetical protein
VGGGARLPPVTEDRLPLSTARLFPQIHEGNHRKTSDPDSSYNCLAWASHHTDRWLDPLKPMGYWPPDVPLRLTLNNLTIIYGAEGWSRCDSPDVEPGYEKLAIYTDRRGLPLHAARQLANGKWTSKLGELEDIEHDDLQIFDGSSYGTPARYMRRLRV